MNGVKLHSRAQAMSSKDSRSDCFRSPVRWVAAVRVQRDGRPPRPPPVGG
jgi:hypothetical protein